MKKRELKIDEMDSTCQKCGNITVWDVYVVIYPDKHQKRAKICCQGCGTTYYGKYEKHWEN